jgi:hypothetical protein
MWKAVLLRGDERRRVCGRGNPAELLAAHASRPSAWWAALSRSLNPSLVPRSIPSPEWWANHRSAMSARCSLQPHFICLLSTMYAVCCPLWEARCTLPDLSWFLALPVQDSQLFMLRRGASANCSTRASPTPRVPAGRVAEQRRESRSPCSRATVTATHIQMPDCSATNAQAMVLFAFIGGHRTTR